MAPNRQIDILPLPEFSGREVELSKLEKLWRRKRGALVVCIGRRRIGKSRLVAEFGKNHAEEYWEIQGLAPRPGQQNDDQLAHFGEKLAGFMGLPEAIPLGSWQQAFALLAQAVPAGKRTVVLLDEISWMGKHDADFSGKLKEAWDTRFSLLPNLVLVLCGSVSAWIDENILRNTGFMDRPALRIQLGELPLHTCNEMVWGRKNQVSAMEKLRMLAVTGGVPRYLEELDPAQSSSENLGRLCFDPSGALFRTGDGLSEFEMIFDEVFQARAGTYRRIIETLLGGARTLSQVSESMGKARSGNLSAYLHDLELAGYLREEPHFAIGSGTGKVSHFRLGDNYMRFYLKYIEPRRKAIGQGSSGEFVLEDLPGWQSVLGFQFENLVLNNLEAVEKRLGISGKVLRAGPYRQTATKRRKGCQVDLMLETEHSLYLCEIKLRRSIGKEVVGEVAEKWQRLSMPRSQKHLNKFPVLIYAGELEPALAKSDYFRTCINFGDLLKK